MQHPSLLVAVVEIEHGANVSGVIPPWFSTSHSIPCSRFRQNILWAEPRPLDDGLAAPLSGHGLDQGAFGPVNVFHDRSLTRSRPGAPAVTQLMAVRRHRYVTLDWIAASR